MESLELSSDVAVESTKPAGSLGRLLGSGQLRRCDARPRARRRWRRSVRRGGGRVFRTMKQERTSAEGSRRWSDIERLKLRRRIVESDQSAIKPTPIRCLGLERRILVVWTGVIPIWETALRPQHSGFCLGKRLCRTHQQYRDHSTYTTRQDTAWPDDAHRRAYTCGPRTDCIDAHARRAQTLLPAVQPPTQLAVPLRLKRSGNRRGWSVMSPIYARTISATRAAMASMAEPSVVTARRFSGSISNLSYIAVTSPSVCARSART
jgi:hypothetical protein